MKRENIGLVFGLITGKCGFFDSFAKSLNFYKRKYWLDIAKKLNVQFIYVQKNSLQSITTYTCGYWSLFYLYNKSRNNIKKKKNGKY